MSASSRKSLGPPLVSLSVRWVGSISASSLRKVVCTERTIDGLQSFAGWYADHGATFATVQAGLDDPALQLYSSGTTGLPKGIVLSHRGMLSTSRTVAQDWKFDADCVLGNPLPTFHVAG